MTRARAIRSYCMLWLLGLAPLFCVAPAAAQTMSSDAAAAAALASDVQSLVTSLAGQRDGLGGWPSRIDDAYTTVLQLQAQLEAARNDGDAKTFRKRYRALMRVAARITRWLANQYDPASDQVPSSDKIDAVVERISSRLELITQVAGRAGVTLDLRAADRARAQLTAARNGGTPAQLRAAVRALRDAADALQDALPDPES